MKLKTTNKEIRNQAANIYRFGYCQIQALLYFKQAFAYTSGVYGWNADFYEVDNCIISTGYRPIGNITLDYETVRKAEKEAEIIVYSTDMPYDEKKTHVNELLTNLLKEGNK